MRSRRPSDLVDAVDATAEDLPFPSSSFDASMATFTVHQWADLQRGLAEMRRVTRKRVVVLTCDPRRLAEFWLRDCAPELIEVQMRRYPSIEEITEGLGGATSAQIVPIPKDCTDGFTEAYFARPEMFLRHDVRHASSAWSFLEKSVEDRCVSALTRDLESGRWDERYGFLRSQDSYEGSLTLVTGF